MRVLLVVHGYPPQGSGGTEIYVRSLAHDWGIAVLLVEHNLDMIYVCGPGHGGPGLVDPALAVAAPGLHETAHDDDGQK